jgi:hypothetical protein
MLTWTAPQREARRRRLNPRREAASQLRSALQVHSVPGDLGTVTFKAC